MKENIDFLRLKEFSIKLLVAVSVFTLTVFFTPNFNISSFPMLVLSSLFIICLDYFMSVVTGIHDIPLGRGIVGFTSASIFIYMSQFFIAGYTISLISSFIAAAIYGVISSMMPNRA